MPWPLSSTSMKTDTSSLDVLMVITPSFSSGIDCAAAREANVALDRVVMIGDSLETDIAAAGAAGGSIHLDVDRRHEF